MTQKCSCEACAVAAHRMKYITQLIEWAYPHIFTAHSKVMVHFNNDDPNRVEIGEEHDAQQDMLRMFKLIEDMHIYSREVRTIYKSHNSGEARD